MSITLKDAKKIAKKLDAEVKEARKHTMHRIVIEGTYVGQFGLSRSSRGKDKSLHDIAQQICISQNQARRISGCQLSKEQYIQILQSKGIL